MKLRHKLCYVGNDEHIFLCNNVKDNTVSRFIARSRCPFRLDPAFGFFSVFYCGKIGRAVLPVNGNAVTFRDKADNIITRKRITALRKLDDDVVFTLNDNARAALGRLGIALDFSNIGLCIIFEIFVLQTLHYA